MNMPTLRREHNMRKITEAKKEEKKEQKFRFNSRCYFDFGSCGNESI